MPVSSAAIACSRVIAGPAQHAGRARAEPAVEHARHGQRLGDAAVDDDEPRARAASQHAHGRSARA